MRGIAWIGGLVAAASLCTASCRAATLTQTDATWSATSGMTMHCTTVTPLAAGDRILVAFPEEFAIKSGTLTYTPSTSPVKVSGQTTVTFVRNVTDRTIMITVPKAIAAGTALTMTFDTRILLAYTSTTYAQQTVAVMTLAKNGSAYDYGLALLTNANQVLVTVGVPLFLTMHVDDTTMDLGTLSPLTVGTAQQSYTIATNNVSGAALMLTADGPLRTADGHEIPDVSLNNVIRPGVAMYGMVVSAAEPLYVEDVFRDGDYAIPRTRTVIAQSTEPINERAVSITYRAGSDGDTVAGVYHQAITATVTPVL